VRSQLLLVLAAGLLLAAQQTASPEIKQAMKQLEGTWLVVSATMDGKDLPDARGGAVVFAGAQLTFKDKAGKEEKYTYRLDLSRKPRMIDFTPEKAKANVAPGRGIYELRGDTLRLCVGPPNRRPTEFSDTKRVLWTLKRKGS
jgi:uncharacterized protein (TIGR03067 family)